MELSGLGKRLQTLRLSKGLSQGDLEKQTGMLRCYVSRIENGHALPSLETLEKFAAAFGMPVAEILRDEGDLAKVAEEVGTPMTPEEIRFLAAVGHHSAHLSEQGRKVLLNMVKTFAESRVQ